jgi:hypothetical protein
MKLLFLLLIVPLLVGGCGDDTNEPPANTGPTLLAPAQDAIIREGSDLVIELADLDPAREVKVFYRFEGALYYHPIGDKTSVRIQHSLSGLPFDTYDVDIGVLLPDDSHSIIANRRFEYRSNSGLTR